MDKADLMKGINMTPLEKQIIINHCLKDFVYFKNHYLEPGEVDEFIRRIQEESETMFIRSKINDKLNQVTNIKKGIKNKIKRKNGANINLKKIIKDNENELKI